MPVNTCAHCAKTFYWKQVSRHRRFCSRSCWGKWRTAQGLGVRPAPAAPVGSGRAENRYLIERIADDDPMVVMAGARRGQWVHQHRLVVARSLGRPLEAYETVHHINGDTRDNRLANLELRVKNHGKGVVLQCACCGSRDLRAVPLAA